jgi:cytochrome c-type biogenesis protein CcmH
MNPRVFSLITALMLTVAAIPIRSATLADFTFPDPAQEHAFRSLTEQLRCLVCQNESLAASQAELAQDLRREVYEMMRSGKTQEEIIGFLVARYGDFVLYNPPLKPSTYLLWYGPFLLFGLAVVFLIRTLMRQRQSRENELSDAERARLAALLAEATKPQDPPT